MKKRERYITRVTVWGLVLVVVLSVFTLVTSLIRVSRGISEALYEMDTRTKAILGIVTNFREELAITLLKYLDNSEVDRIIKILDLKDREQLLLRHRLAKSNVLIVNETQRIQGSGIVIQYQDKIYVLSAGHLVQDSSDQLEILEQNESYPLKIVRWCPERDLLLLEPPSYFNTQPVELASQEPESLSDILLIGNPMGLVDHYSEGILVKYHHHFFYFHNHIYFGSSGGGVFNKSGQLVGIISFMVVPNSPVKTFVVGGAVRLRTIMWFLEQYTVEVESISK